MEDVEDQVLAELMQFKNNSRHRYIHLRLEDVEGLYVQGHQASIQMGGGGHETQRRTNDWL